MMEVTVYIYSHVDTPWEGGPVGPPSILALAQTQLLEYLLVQGALGDATNVSPVEISQFWHGHHLLVKNIPMTLMADHVVVTTISPGGITDIGTRARGQFDFEPPVLTLNVGLILNDDVVRIRFGVTLPPRRKLVLLEQSGLGADVKTIYLIATKTVPVLLPRLSIFIQDDVEFHVLIQVLKNVELNGRVSIDLLPDFRIHVVPGTTYLLVQEAIEGSKVLIEFLEVSLSPTVLHAFFGGKILQVARILASSGALRAVSSATRSSYQNSIHIFSHDKLLRLAFR
jgi:hypothetical protein